MEDTGDGQKAGERTEHAWAVQILHHLEILEANSASWKCFQAVSYVPIKYMFPPCGALCIWRWGLPLLSFTAQHCSSRGKVGSCNHRFP